jgi:hypothetical protein
MTSSETKGAFGECLYHQLLAMSAPFRFQSQLMCTECLGRRASGFQFDDGLRIFSSSGRTVYRRQLTPRELE